MSYIEKVLTKYEQLQDENALIMQDLKKLESTELNYKSNDKKWNIIQVLNHIKSTEAGTLKYIHKKMKYGGLKMTNWSAGTRAFLMRSLNNSSIKFKMPSVLTQPSVDGSLQSIQNEWNELRDQWRTFIKNFPDEDLNKAVFRHPIFGRLSLLQTMDSMISHQNHHKKQINRIKKTINLNKKI